MGIVNFPTIDSSVSLADLANLVGRLIKEVEFLTNGNIDSHNTREIGGYIVGLTSLKSKNGVVGLSSEITGGDDIRIWAGSVVPEAAPYRVYESGRLVATNGEFTGDITGSTITGSTITGGTVRSGDNNTDRIELSGGKFRGLTAANQITGLYFDIGSVAGTGIADIGFYHNGTKLMEFFDSITKYTIRAASGSTGLTIGGTAATTYAAGNWDFNGALGVSGLRFSYSGVTGPGGTDGHSHAFSVSGSISIG